MRLLCMLLTVSGIALAQLEAPSTGMALLQQMRRAYDGRWFSTLTFTQKTTTRAADGTETIATWYESLRHTDARGTQLRIDTGEPSAGNGVLYSADSLWVFRAGKQVAARPGGNALIPLIEGVYVQPVERTMAELKATGVDLARRVVVGRWHDRPVWVAGAASPGDTTSPQFWVDTANKAVVRAIFSPVPSAPMMDMRLERLVPLAGGWLATRCEFYVNGRLSQVEEYQDWKANVALPPGLFEAATWSTAPHWAGAMPGSSAPQSRAPAKAVLVTGASSGIGRKITERLAAQGLFVYAGARTQPEIDALNAIPNVQAVRLDVTLPGDIAAAVATVTGAGRGLWGVVNNAGVVIVAPLIEAEEKELNFIFNVNLYGPYRITKAFAPLLLESKGRVVNISSLNGIVASPMIGAYSMSKHAIEAYGDALSAEMSRFGMRVSLIEPGNYGTEIGRNMMARMDTSVVKGSRFEPQMRTAINQLRAFENNPPPDEVADAVLDALTSPDPKMRYMVVPTAGQAALTIRKVLEELVQLNEGQKFSYDRDALVKMLDDALARTKPRR